MSEPKLLAIETSAQIGSVALASGDSVLEREIPAPREQTTLIIGLIDEVLAEAGLELRDLDALVLGRGPGSFTGLRVAAGVLQGFSLATGVPIVAVSSLAALALQGLAEHPGTDQALCLVDARMGESYCALYQRAGVLVSLQGEEQLCRPETVTAPAGAWLAIGDALGAHADALAEQAAGAVARLADRGPRARDLVPLARAEVEAGRYLPLESALPVYLREADAWQRI
jgi:tRNA threonylcarbamoyladenosine biosynthesis protein TsaB